MRLICLAFALGACGGHGASSNPIDAAPATDGSAMHVDGGGSGLAAACTPAPGHPAIVDVEPGGESACALYGDGHVACWGLGTFGELGDGQVTHGSCGTGIDCSLAPVRVAAITDAIAIGVAGDNACALHANGTVSCWGDNSAGELGDGLTTHATCTSSDCSRAPVTVSGLSDAVAISVGEITACALRRGGSVVCWGDNDNGQLGDGVATHETCTVSTGMFDCSHVPVAVSGVTDAVEVSVGDDAVCARRSSGALTCWGNNEQGQLGDGSAGSATTQVAVSGITDAVSIQGAFLAGCALHGTGSVACWGWNDDGLLGDGNVTHQACMGAVDCSPSPVAVTGITDAVAISSRWSHACAVHATGAVSCWGDNGHFELGDGSAHAQCGGGCSTSPVTVAGVTSPVAVRAGGFVTCALAADCGVACWGNNNAGGLGDGTTMDRAMATPVVGL